MVTTAPSLLASSDKGNCSRESTCLSAVSLGHGYLSYSDTTAEPLAEIGVGVAVFVVVYRVVKGRLINVTLRESVPLEA